MKRYPFRKQNLAWLAWANNMHRWHGEISDAAERLQSPLREEFENWDANRPRNVGTSDWPGFRDLVRRRPTLHPRYRLS
jgi:hypothetical protein